MIIWGSYVIRKTLGNGDYYCPNCATHRKYTLRKPRRWGHLYWIPLFVMEEFESYVECDTCKKAYREVVLQHDPVREQQQLESTLTTIITQTMALMAKARGEPPSIDKAASAIQALVRIEPPRHAIEAASLIVDREAALQNIAHHADILTTSGKEQLLSAAIAGAPLAERPLALAAQIGASLGMSPAHVQGVLAAAQEEAQAKLN